MIWFLNGGMKTGQKFLFYGKNVRFLKSPPNHVIEIEIEIEIVYFHSHHMKLTGLE